MKNILLILVFSISYISYSQSVYQHISTKGIYDFIDEMHNAQLISLNTAVKSYSRMTIAAKLNELNNKRELLNQRQAKDLDFYLLEYKLELNKLPDYKEKFDLFKKKKNLSTGLNPLGLFYKDSVFTLSIKPIWGIDYYFDDDNNNIYHRWGGAEAYAYVGKHWGFYASLRDNSESERMVEPSFFTLQQGGPYKQDTTGGDYSEMRAGISYTWKWGHIALAKDHTEWGNNYHGSNILAGRTPSFAHVKLYINPVKWFEFSYFHGWLVSEIVDSARSYPYGDGKFREVFHPKYYAANIFTIQPFKNLRFSFGNSIVYSDLGVHPAYLIPFAFFKSIDHTLNGTNNNSGQNSQMFFDISSRQIKNLHLYGSLFIDELAISRLTNPDEHNFLSYKIGGNLSNFPFQNLSLTCEYTLTLPMTYQHLIPTTTFESNFYNMGHYLRDNSQEIFARISYKPIRGLVISTSLVFAQHGDDFIYGQTDEPPDEMPILENITFENTTIGVNASYEFISNAYLFLKYMNIDVYDEKGIRAQKFFTGRKNIISTGFNIGF
ncbi:MAG: hypothetical protein K8R53_15060, partial [Bacteroidales bacterium]|nr:hypothetical protein [Bacteroidales bacterium]